MPFFSGNFSRAEDLTRIAQRVASHHSDRTALVDALRSQAIAYGLRQSAEPLLQKLAQPNSVAVVTGQQLGLFGGPLYTLYKIISSIQLAERYSQELGIEAVPVFWLEGEDHDFDEIAGSGLLSGDDPIEVRYAPAKTSDGASSIGRMVITEEIVATLDAFEVQLQPTEFTPDLMQLLRKAYAPGQTMLKAFVTVLNFLLGDGRVLFVSPDDPALKTLSAQLFEKEIRESERSSGILRETSDQLGQDYHVQVQTKPTNLFVQGPSGRVAIDRQGDGYISRDGVPFTQSELLNKLQQEPASFSPNVVLRPLMQDTVLPTAAYVAGPGEVAYFAQFKGLYEWAGLEMPVIYPRASATILEKKIEKVLERYELDIPAFEEQFDPLFGRIVKAQMEVDVDEAFKKASSYVHQAVNEIKPIVEGVDRSLAKSTDATRGLMLKEWTKLKDRVLKAERQQQDVLKGQIYRASSNLFPFQIPQERALSPLYFLNKYGLDFGQKLISTLDLDTTSHQVIQP